MSADHTEPEIACSLPPTELSDRRVAWQVLCERALRARRSIPRGMQLVFAARGGVEGELRALVRLEAQCCAFADWTVRCREGEVALDVTGSTEAAAAIRAMFDGPYESGAP